MSAAMLILGIVFLALVAGVIATFFSDEAGELAHVGVPLVVLAGIVGVALAILAIVNGTDWS